MAFKPNKPKHITDQLTVIPPHFEIQGMEQKKKSDTPQGGEGGGGGGGSATVVAATPGVSKEDQLMAAYDRMYAVFSPGELTYEGASEEEIAGQVASWLRPTYDRAIETRKKQTKTYGAELDADAIARGMGASTYVTDVKSRQTREEGEDVALLESEYGAALASAVGERLENEKDRMLEVEMYNRDLDLDVSGMAYGAAQGLVGVGGSAARGGGSGGGRSSVRRGTTSRSSAATEYKDSPETCAAFLSVLEDDERLAVYAGSDAQSAAYRDEIIASVGLTGFYQLQKQYSVAP